MWQFCLMSLPDYNCGSCRASAGFVALAFAAGRKELLAWLSASVLLSIISTCPSGLHSRTGWDWHTAQKRARSTSSASSLLLSPLQKPLLQVFLFVAAVAFHFLLFISVFPRPPLFQIKNCFVFLLRAPFCSSFFSFVHPPQYHQDDVKHLISSLFFLLRRSVWHSAIDTLPPSWRLQWGSKTGWGTD